MRARFVVNCMWLLLMCGPVWAWQASGAVDELYEQAKAAQDRGDLAGAIAKYQEILKVAPKLGPAYNNLGALYFRQRDYNRAAETLQRGLKVEPHMASASALLGISLYQIADYTNARPALEAALRANPSDVNVQTFLAKDLMKLGRYEMAVAQLQQLTARDPKNQEAWYLMARIHMKLSEQALAKMNAIDPDSLLAHQLSAEVMESMNNYEGAVVELKKAVAMEPRHPGTHYELGEAYFSLSQWNSAREQYESELQLDPSNCMAQWKLGSVLLESNADANDALGSIDKSLNLCPTLAGARLDRARALVKLNRSREAVTDLEAAEKANPGDPSIHFLLAKVYRAVGKTEEAGREMEVFRKLDETARAATAERAGEVIKNQQTAH